MKTVLFILPELWLLAIPPVREFGPQASCVHFTLKVFLAKKPQLNMCIQTHPLNTCCLFTWIDEELMLVYK